MIKTRWNYLFPISQQFMFLPVLLSFVFVEEKSKNFAPRFIIFFITLCS